MDAQYAKDAKDSGDEKTDHLDMKIILWGVWIPIIKKKKTVMKVLSQ